MKYDAEEEGGRTRRKNVSCRNCHHPWSEHNFGKGCRLVKRTGMASPMHKGHCTCVEFVEPKKRRRIRKPTNA
jgi:hypothetical protein